MVLPIPGAALASPGEMICRLSPRTLQYIDASQNLLDYLGRPLVDLREQSFLRDLHPDDRALADEELQQVCDYGERNDLVLRVKGRSTSWHYVRIYAQARYDSTGSLNHIRCNLKDITDRMRAEQELSRRTEKLIIANAQLRKINKELEATHARLVHSEKLAALGTLAAGMAHEINNPLAVAINNTRILDRELVSLLELTSLLLHAMSLEPGERPGLAARIAELQEQIDLPYLRESLPSLIDSTYRGLLRVARIVEKLKEFARLDRAEIDDVDINESIELCLMMLSEPLSRWGIAVVRRLGSLPTTRSTPSQLNQVLLNVLQNSVDAVASTGRSEGKIEIETRSDDRDIIVAIRDNGAGIPAESISRVFDPFFTTKPPGRGTGLGLSTCHGIITQLGGRIELDSQASAGTSFVIRIPLHPST
jgi:C4-dicarboxylate-specific signal transduction histidine kinase